MKLNGFLTGTGKIGSIVVSKVNGQTIAREYNPNVSNPNTQAQVNQRARLKIASQLAAVLAPYIAIAKKGALSGRNAFVQRAMNSIYAVNGQAVVSYENLQLTDGSISIPSIVLDRASGDAVNVSLLESAAAQVDRVVYVGFKVTSESQLQSIGSVVVSDAGSDGTFPSQLPYTDAQVVVYAYALRSLNSQAKSKYNNYSITNGEDVAKLLGTRSVANADFQATATRGASLFVGEDATVTLGENECRLFLTAVGNGTVSGAGVKTIGSTVTVVATPAANSDFLGWFVNGSNQAISLDLSYSFTITGQTDLVAMFEQRAAGQVQISAETNNSDWGKVSFSGTSGSGSDSISKYVAQGASVSLFAFPASGYEVEGWYLGSTKLSGSPSFSYVVNEDTSLECRFMVSGD